MSLILDALRKSEQQRRLGETPTVLSESAWQTRRRHRGADPGRRWLLLLLPLLVVGVAAGWYVLRNNAGSDGWLADFKATPTPAQPPAASVDLPPALPAANPGALQAPAQPMSTATPSTRSDSTVPHGPDDMIDPTQGLDPALRARVQSGELVPNHPQLLRPMPPTPAPQYVPPEAALPEPLAEVAQAATTQSATRVENPPATTSNQPAAAPAQPSHVADAMAASSTPSTSSSAPAPVAATASEPRVWELPLALRQALPQLKISMHVWKPDAANRFIILDGTRASEGQLAGKELKVIEIRRDGVLLEFNGTRFMLPRAGQ